jgi:hypothetical protein
MHRRWKMIKRKKDIPVLMTLVLLSSCAAAPSTKNPWQTPDRDFIVSSKKEAAQLDEYMQPCMEYARETFSDAYRRFIEESPQKTTFAIEALDDNQRNFYVAVTNVAGSQIDGRINNINRNARVKGRAYSRGDYIQLTGTDIVDWLIIYPDRPEEGNLLGKYLLLRQEDLVSGSCNPQDPEFKHFRLFLENYSFVPPVGNGWQIRGKNADAEVSMANLTGGGPHEVDVVYATRYQSPRFATNQDFIKKIAEVEKKNVGDPERVTLLKHEVTEYKKKKARCVLSRQVIEDRQALLSKSGERGPMIREILSLACVHPAEQDTVVDLVFSHRYQPGHRDPEFPDKAAAVFDSLAFTVRNYH